MKLCFDIDDTILFSEMDQDGEYVLKKYDPAMVHIINKLYETKNEIIIYTGRHWNHLLNTEQQLKYIGLKYHSLVMGKPVADFYVDDKAFNPGQFKKMIKDSLNDFLSGRH